MQQHIEILFFKVFRNKYLRCYILNSIKSARDVNIFSNIETRQDYNSIVSLEWMLKNHQYEMIIDKVKSGHYVHINNKSIKSLITSCKRYDIYEVLFKYKRNDMERIDLIEESVKLNSLFALKSFIQLNGGIDSVANTIRNNGTGEYTSLLDIALSFASMDVANYLLLTPGLDWYTESMLLHNAFSQRINYYNAYGYTYDKKNKEAFEESYIKESQQTTTTTTTIINKSLRHSIYNERIGKHYKFTSVSSLPFVCKTEHILEFIQNKLHQPLDELIKNCKNRDIVDKVFKCESIDKELLVDLVLNHGLYDNNEFGPVQESSSTPYILQMLICSLNFNGQHSIGHLKYLILLHSLSISTPTFKSTIQLLKSYDNNNNNEKELLDLYLNHIFQTNGNEAIPNYNYFANYHFIKGDYEPILNNYQQLDRETIYNLWVLVMFNFSFEGLELYIKLKQMVENAISNSITTVVTTHHFLSSTIIYYSIIDAIKRLKLEDNQPTNVPYEQVESFIQMCTDNQTDQFQIPWIYINKILLENYPTHYLESLFPKFPQLVDQFNALISNSHFSFKVLPFKVDKDGEFQFDKIDLVLNGYKNNTTLILNSLFVDITHERIYQFETLQKVKLVNYLVDKHKELLVTSNSSSQILSQILKIILLNDCGGIYRNGDHGSNDKITISESFEIYSSLNKLEINSILSIKSSDPHLENQTLENYLFNISLVNSIFGTERNKIKILSMVNENGDSYGSNIKQLSSMKTDTIDDKIEYIKLIYSSGLLSSFGCSLSLSLVEKLILEIKSKCGMVTIKYEEELVQLVGLMNGSSKFASSTTELLYHLSLKNGLNRLFCKLMKLQSIQITNEIENDPMLIEIEYNEIKNQIQLNYTNHLISTSNEAKSLFSLLYNGNFKELLNAFENNDGPIIYDNVDEDKEIYLKLFLKLSFKYCDFKFWFSIYKNILKEMELDALLYWSIKFGRLDILVYLIQSFKIERDQFLLILRQTIRKGCYPIVKYLLKNYTNLIHSPTSSKLKQLGSPSINKLFVVSLLHGRVNIADLIVSTVGQPKYGFIMDFDWILRNGHSNVLKYIIKNDHFKLSNTTGVWEFIFFDMFRSIGKKRNFKYLVQKIQDTHRKTISNQSHHYKNRIINFKDSYHNYYK